MLNIFFHSFIKYKSYSRFFLFALLVNQVSTSRTVEKTRSPLKCVETFVRRKEEMLRTAQILFSFFKLSYELFFVLFYISFCQSSWNILHLIWTRITSSNFILFLFFFFFVFYQVTQPSWPLMKFERTTICVYMQTCLMYIVQSVVHIYVRVCVHRVEDTLNIASRLQLPITSLR